MHAGIEALGKYLIDYKLYYTIRKPQDYVSEAFNESHDSFVAALCRIVSRNYWQDLSIFSLMPLSTVATTC